MPIKPAPTPDTFGTSVFAHFSGITVAPIPKSPVFNNLPDVVSVDELVVLAVAADPRPRLVRASDAEVAPVPLLQLVELWECGCISGSG